MKFWLLAAIVCYTFIPSSLFSQYYLRGEVRDEKGSLLPGVTIKLQSKGNYLFTSGSEGFFGIPSSLPTDTVTFSYEGYETIHKAVQTQQYQAIQLSLSTARISVSKNRLSSQGNYTHPRNLLSSFAFGESYSNLIENNFVNTHNFSETKFSLNIDRAAYSNIRRFLSNEMTVPTDAVRIEEMLNYFNFRILNPNTNTNQFSCSTTLSSCPWNSANKLCFINIMAPKLNLDSLPASNLVFLIDVSGSMERPNRLPLLQSAFKLLVENLRERDTISIVTYGGGVAVRLASTSGSEKEKINNLIDSLSADGDTPGEGAIRTAYYLAKKSFIKNGNNRIILATDGDFNVGQNTEKELDDLVSAERESGIYLTCIGVGMGNYKDSKLETLAKKGNGNFAYLDNIAEAEKVLVQEFTKTLYAVANDVFLTVHFNPDIIKEYRLIGFDNKRNALLDSSSELLGGEIGSGHNSLAIFELIPTTKTADTSTLIAKLNLQYRLPKTQKQAVQEFDFTYQPLLFNNTDTRLRFATAIAMFGSLLKESTYAKNYSYEQVLNIAQNAADVNNSLEQEFIALVHKATKIYTFKRKKH